jgi:hypothetical protein
MSNDQRRVLIALLATEGENERLNYLRPILKELAAQRSKHFSITVEEFLDQPSMMPDSRWQMLRKTVHQYYLGRAWDKYLNGTAPPDIWSFRSLTNRHLAAKAAVAAWKIALAPRSASATLARRRSLFKESCARQKHIRAWQRVLDRGYNYVLVIESDAIFRPQSVDNLLRLFAAPPDGGPLYMDLAGGFDLAQLGFSKVAGAPQTIGEMPFASFLKPVTNTTCAYFVDNELVGMLCKSVARHPWLRLSPIDWMLNAFFILNTKDRVLVRCLHADPSCLIHGSFAGQYESTIR